MGTGKIVELLAPAKDYAHGCAAIDCGADALYVGAPAFGARAGAAVPADEIGRLCDYAHRFGAKVFVTMNTLVYESELSEAEWIARDMYRAGADALIVQDAAFLRMDLPPIELHASTQIFNMDPVRARFWYEAGFTRNGRPRSTKCGGSPGPRPASRSKRSCMGRSAFATAAAAS